VEVPRLVGLSFVEAETLLDAAGLETSATCDSGLIDDTGMLVARQSPVAGSLVEEASLVSLVVRKGERWKKPSKPRETKGSTEKFVVCIDPGHQCDSDTTPELIGPGSDSVKPRMTAGVTGAVTGVPEYEVALQISMNLKRVLEARGVRVVMTRTTNDVNLSNKERAQIANDAKADLFLRVHGDKSPEQSAVGLSTLYPKKNSWTKGIASRSKRAAAAIQSGAIASTEAADRGTIERNDFAGFNWSKVPSVLVQCGFLSNPVEDRLLASPHYQDKLAVGMADGIMRYLESNP
jgi:N-acetylmuramoyl-L-alanine amidase